MVGSAIVRALKKQGYTNLLLRARAELDLLDQKATMDFFAKEKPEYVILAAAKVGGIVGNQEYPADFIYENLTVQNNVIHDSFLADVKKLLFLGSSCIYPREAPQPIKEEYLLSGPLEETNKAYAVAKIAGIVKCQSYNRQHGTNYISVMPTNLYGPNDRFDLHTSHVLPALLRKFHEAKMKGDREAVVWGTGIARREFLHVDDLAAACVYLMENYDGSEIVNIGTGEDIAIKEVAELMKDIVGFKGKIVWDKTKPDGTLLKRLDVSRLHSLGWKHSIDLADGLKDYYEWFLKNFKE